MELLLLKLITMVGSISYLGLFLFIALFSFIAVSAEFVLIATGVIASRGYIDLLPTFIVAYFAVMAGDLIAYFIGYSVHHSFKRISFLKKFVKRENLYFGRLWFNRYGTLSIPIARFIMGIRFQTFVFAGIMEMKLKRFLVSDALANLLFTPLFVTLGYLAGDEIVALLSGFKTHPIIGVAIFVAFTGTFIWLSRRMKKKHAEQSVEEPVD